MPPKMMRLQLVILILATSLMSAGQTGITATSTPSASLPQDLWIPLLPPRPLGPAIDAPQIDQGGMKAGAKYPHALFVLEASCLAAAITQDGRSYAAYENQSGKKFTAINLPIGIGLGLGGWKLEKSRHKPLRILGHGLIWGAVGGYAVDYFRR